MDKTLIVTGGSRGIGAATALLAAREGYKVCINFRKDEVAAVNVMTSIKAAGGIAIACKADIGTTAGIDHLFRVVDEQFGRLDGLVNNAGILETQARLEDIDADRLQRIFQTNVIGAFLCAREAVKRMSTKNGGDGGTIVNISSGAAISGSPGEYVDYAASKGAMDTMTVGLAKEVAEEGIRVNGVRPGFIYTDIHADGGEPNRVDRVKAFVPLKRGGTATEVAEAILWLLSDKSSFSTGTFIDVTGGK